MKILFSTGCLYYLPLKDVFHVARKAGFDGCDLVIDGRFNNDRYIETVMECGEILPICSIHAPFVRIKSWVANPDILTRTIDIARKVGARIVNFHPPSWYSMEMKFIKWFKKVADFQEELGCGDIALAIENMPLVGKRVMLAPYIFNDYEDLIAFGLERNLFFTYDTTHLGTFGGDSVAVFLKYFRTKRLKNIHLSDYGNFKSHLFLGTGELSIVKLLNTLRRLGYDEFVTLELAPDELPRTQEWLMKMLAYETAFMRLHLGMTDNE